MIRKLALLILGIACLTACTQFSADHGFNIVKATSSQHLDQDLTWVQSDLEADRIQQQVNTLLAHPLDIEDAVQIALLNNKRLQASFSQLAISEADFVQAGRLPNPIISALRTTQTGNNGTEYKIEQSISFNIFALLSIPQTRAMTQRQFAQAQREVSLEVLRVAFETRLAYYNTLAAEEMVHYTKRIQDAAESSAKLAQRMTELGHFNALQQAQEQNFYAEAALNVARAQQVATTHRERLTRLLGLWGQQITFTVPKRLPDLPVHPLDMPDVERTAIAQRLDLQALRLQIEALAQQLGLTKSTRFINVLELGPARTLEGTAAQEYKTGYTLSFNLPLFDLGDVKVVRANAIYMKALNLAAQTAIEVRSEVREAYQNYRASYDIAQHYRDEIIPIRKRMSAENQRRYNGMLISVFDLLDDARQRISTVNNYIGALRDFWLAETNLQMALIGKPRLTEVKLSNVYP
ncbi:MAG: TolC family protein [Methylophilaceae bacterium]|nr:TolC family protein [Methylophilaceae bacterium]